MSKIAKKESYIKSLRENKLTDKHIKDLLNVLSRHLCVKSINELSGLEKNKLGISKHLDRLPLFLVLGSKSWQGLSIGFPGNTSDLTTGNVGTPFLRMLLYPIVELFQKVNNTYFNKEAKCLYFMGARFPDVFIRKFKLISTVIPHLVILTSDLVKSIRPHPPDDSCRQNRNLESYLQARICALMCKQGIVIPDDQKPYTIKYLSYEVQTAEGTDRPERLDILGYDQEDHSLVAFEIKGKCSDAELNNLFTQGMEHRNWLEQNKMAVKLIVEGPSGRKINTKKRVKLVLGVCREKVSDIFRQFKEAELKDKHQQISFVQITKERDVVRIDPAEYERKNS